jgi:N-acetylmuramoyl-L-alanine amidase
MHLIINIFLLAFLLFFNGSYLLAQDANNVSIYNTKVNKYLAKNTSINAYFKIGNNGISMYASKANKQANKPEFFIEWDKLDALKKGFRVMDMNMLLYIYNSGSLEEDIAVSIKEFKYTPPAINKKGIKKLKGYKIAIDPGHISNNIAFGRIEDKSVNFKVKNAPVDSVAFTEGQLTYATAVLLKQKLELQGADVFMTRKKKGGNAFEMSFENWIKKDNIDKMLNKRVLTKREYDLLMNPEISIKEKFQDVFKNIEISKRAEIINDFKPDLTIVIHYNADEKNTGWNKVSKKNYNMAFVPGSFLTNDLRTRNNRFDFLRLLISDDIEESIKLSNATVNNFENILFVPSASIKNATYLKANCLGTNTKGVFCRNLQLTRKINGPLIYGETLYQDNAKECLILNEQSNKTLNKRVIEVAQSYYLGIMNYLESNDN